MARPGIEPGTTPYKGDALPLSYPASLYVQTRRILSLNINTGHSLSFPLYFRPIS